MRIKPKSLPEIPSTPPQKSVKASHGSKIQRLGVGVLANLVQSSSVSLKSVPLSAADQSSMIFESLLLATPLQLNSAKFFILTPMGSLEVSDKDNSASVIIIIGNTLYFKETYREQIQDYFNEGKLGDIDLNNVKLIPVSETLWKSTLLISISILTSLFDTTLEATEKKVKKEAQKDPNVIEKSTPLLPKTLKIGTFKKQLEKFWKSQITLILTDQLKDANAAKERRVKEETQEQIQKKSDLVKHEILQYENLLRRVKESITKNEIQKNELFDLIKEWTESLPPFPLRQVNTLTIWRELKPKLMELFKNFYTKHQAEQMQKGK